MGKKASSSNRLDVSDKTVVVTGTVPGMQRNDVERALRKLGARCTGSVSKQTDYVFAMADAGSKKAAAERLGIPVLDDKALFALIGTPALKPKPAKVVTAAAKAKVAARKPAPGGFSGKTVVITGTLSKERAEVADELEAAGAKVVGSVSANTHYLVTGAGVGATKLAKATALGITIIDEARMNQMLLR